MRTAGIALVGALTVVLAACGGGATIGSPAATGNGSPASTAGATPTPPATPAPTPTPTPTPTEEASVAPSFTPAPAPQAEIVTADATTAGTLGTYTIDDSGSDSPWLPFSALPAVGLSPTEMPVIRFVDGVGIGQFQAQIAADADTSGASAQAVAGGTLGADGRSFTVGPLPVGRWVLGVRVFRADGRGDGLTFWAVTVR